MKSFRQYLEEKKKQIRDAAARKAKHAADLVAMAGRVYETPSGQRAGHKDLPLLKQRLEKLSRTRPGEGFDHAHKALVADPENNINHVFDFLSAHPERRAGESLETAELRRSGRTADMAMGLAAQEFAAPKDREEFITDFTGGSPSQRIAAAGKARGSREIPMTASERLDMQGAIVNRAANIAGDMRLGAPSTYHPIIRKKLKQGMMNPQSQAARGK